MSAFSTRTNKPGSVVPIDLARRRLRQAQADQGQARKSDPLMSALTLVAVIAVLSAVWLGLVCASHGDYEAAVLYPLWLIIPGTIPLMVCYLRRRRHRGGQPPPAMPVREFGNRARRARLRR